MSAQAPGIPLAAHLKALKPPTVQREHQKLARLCPLEGVDHVSYRARLIEMELIDRERRMVERRIKAARFPAKKSLDSFDFAAIPS
jgi:DNA replication protein DnaC